MTNTLTPVLRHRLAHTGAQSVWSEWANGVGQNDCSAAWCPCCQHTVGEAETGAVRGHCGFAAERVLSHRRWYSPASAHPSGPTCVERIHEGKKRYDRLQAMCHVLSGTEHRYEHTHAPPSTRHSTQPEAWTRAAQRWGVRRPLGLRGVT